METDETTAPDVDAEHQAEHAAAEDDPSTATAAALDELEAALSDLNLKGAPATRVSDALAALSAAIDELEAALADYTTPDKPAEQKPADVPSTGTVETDETTGQVRHTDAAGASFAL